MLRLLLLMPGSAAGYPAAPPQTRTRPIKAYGSSVLRFRCGVGHDKAFQAAPSVRRDRPASAFAIHCDLGNTIEDLRVSTVLPHNGSATRPPPSLLPGSDGTRSPVF